MTLEEIQKDLDDDGFCGFLQIRAVSFDASNDTLILTLPYRDVLSHGGGSGQVHGGVIGAFIDTAASFAVMASGVENCPTVNYRTDLLRPVIRSSMTATARIRRQGRTLAYVDIDVTDNNGKLVDVGRSNFAIISG